MPLPLKRFSFPLLDSTNSWAKQHLDSCPLNGLTVVVAEEQSGGRGRFARHWISPPGCNLYLTFVFFLPTSDLPDPFLVVKHLSHTLQQLLQEKGIEADLKWPNDLQIKGKKVAGILCETLPHGEKTALLLGLGLNVNMPQELLQTIDQPATSLLKESGQLWDREELLEELILAVGRSLETAFFKRMKHET